ncbi:MAG: hypothetical protein GY832_11935 [Chloroflexi bacterium]|nr:hypothetical protein [Chloroflexota bacterium]
MTKKWYTSKMVWLGIIEFVMGVLGLLAPFFDAGNFTAGAIVSLLMGVLTIVLRVWFTDTKLVK